MGNFQPSFDSTESFIAEWHDCYISDSKITGFVCTFQLKTKKHHFLGLNDLPQLLKEASKRKRDVYLSLNAFEYGLRQTEHLKQIRNVGVDIDCYKLNISIDQALDKIKIMILKGDIPNPNLVIFSGRGIQLLYSISGGASPKMAFLSQYITTQFIAELRHLGADTSATDVTRVFRLPYSINSKSDKQVTLEIWRTLEYSLEELYSFCKPLEQRKKRKKGKLYTIPSQQGLKNLYSLNAARKNDLEALVSLRMGNIESRNVLIYIYAYTVALLLKNKEATLGFTQQLNDRLADPQKVKEIMRTAGNGYDDAIKFFEEFKKHDFKMWYRQTDGIIRPMKNETIIEKLEIQPEEIKQLTTIINADVKRDRNTIKKRKKRREEGIQKREDYLEEQKEKTDDKLWQLQKAMERHPDANKKQLAETIGISRNHLYRLLDKLKV